MEHEKRQDEKLWTEIRHNLSQDDFYDRLSRYTLSSDQMIQLGYPFKDSEGNIVINHVAYQKRSQTKHKRSELHKNNNTGETNTVVQQPLPDHHICERCGNNFVILPGGNSSSESCKYHPGKVLIRDYRCRYTCCYEWCGSEPCSVASSHVWTGIVPGSNKVDDFKCTEPSTVPKKGVFALNTEMCFTTAGLEMCRISMVNYNGLSVYETYVKPPNPIIDFNTTYSGISEQNLVSSKPFEQVQQDVLNFLDESTILIGHSLEHDLQGLKIVHHNCVDTSVVYPHTKGLPFKNSLNWLVKKYLHRTIQEDGRDVRYRSCEDARSYMELMLRRV